MPNLKFFYTCLLCFFSVFVFAQEVGKDTFQLKELVIRNHAKHPKIKKFKYSSSDILLDRLDYYPEIVTLSDNLPAGYLHSVTFAFNHGFMEIPGMRKELKDVDLELVFYEANDDNTPGKKIPTHKIVTVPKEFSGKMEIMLANENVLSNGRIFIGLKRLTSATPNVQDFEVDCIYKESKPYMAYHRQNGKEGWEIQKMLKGPAMTVKIEVL